jgi:hypothetical protein
MIGWTTAYIPAALHDQFFEAQKVKKISPAGTHHEGSLSFRKEINFCKSFIFKDLQRAGDETRTRDIFLGKEVLYQLSYTRVLPLKEGMMRQKRAESRNICLLERVVSASASVS